MKVLLLILGMTVVTYLPRLLPALVLDRFSLPPWFRRWLKAIPYAALGALIFPGLLEVDREQPLVGLTGGMVALLLSLKGISLPWVMAAAIISAYVIGIAL